MSAESVALASGAISGIIGVVGVVVGGIITTLSSVWFSRHQKEQAIKGCLQALHDEAEALQNIYMEGIGKKIEVLKEGEIIPIYHASQDYFTTYNANVFLIGHIEDHDLRKSIVTTYVFAKSLIDSYRLNNIFVEQYVNANDNYKVTQNQLFLDRAKEKYKTCQELAPRIKERHTEVKRQLQELLRRLHKKGILKEE